jgi:photosystem II stability/assembly factor-like uncharacterized protein
MKMNKIQVFALLISIIFLAGGLLFIRSFRKKEDPRKRYERFLTELNKKVQNIAKNDKEEVPAALDQPEMASFQEYLMTMDPSTGKIPRERLLDAYRSTLRIQEEKSGYGSLLWQGYGADMGGRTRMIMYDPNDTTHEKVWAGGVTGGLWYNNNIQDSLSPWVPVGDFWPDLAIRCMAYDPNNPLTFYIGTGEAETAIQTYRESSGLGDGIWKSTDGGVTWNLLSSTTGFAYIPRIVVRNENGSSAIYAAVVSGLYHGIHNSLPSDGLFRSTDGGITWNQVLPNITGYNVPYSPSDVVLGASGRIYVGTMSNLDGNGAAVLLFSDTGLPGSWNVNTTFRNQILADPSYNIPGRVVFGCAPSNPNVVYALIASGFIYSGDSFKYYHCSHILRSGDKGMTWVNKNLPTNLNGQTNFANLAWHALDIAVDPNSPNTVYIGGLDVHKTTDGGSNWSRVSDWKLWYTGGGPHYIHPDQHCIVYKPGSSTVILFSTDGGIFYTSNGSNAQPVFEQHNKRYNTLQFYTCAINPVSGANNFIGGLQDNSTLYYSGTPLTINDLVGEGDGAYCFYDEYDPSIFFTSEQYNYYCMYSNAQFVKKLDTIKSGIFINPSDYDNNLNNIYANAVNYIGYQANMILRIEDLTGSAVNTFVLLNTNTPVYFSSVRYSPYSPSGKSTIFLGTVAGRLYRVSEAQSNSPVVSEITGTNFPAANISSIAIAGSEDTLLVTFSNYGVSSVFQTYDGGITWQNKDTNLPDMPIRWCLYHPENSKQALLATETGVWSTQNLDAANTVWEPDVNGMPNVRTDMLVFRESDHTVLAATHGRGCFTATWDVVYTGINNEPKPNFSVYPNPASNTVHITFNNYSNLSIGQADEKTILSIRNILGEELLSKQIQNGESVIDVSELQKGLYFAEIKTGNKQTVSTKLIIQK